MLFDADVIVDADAAVEVERPAFEEFFRLEIGKRVFADADADVIASRLRFERKLKKIF